MQEADRDSLDSEWIELLRESDLYGSIFTEASDSGSHVDTVVHHETHGDESRYRLCTDLLLRLLG